MLYNINTYSISSKINIKSYYKNIRHNTIIIWIVKYLYEYDKNFDRVEFKNARKQ